MFGGMVIALAAASVYPEHTSLLLLCGGIGGVFPDFDLAFIHRRTFHFPVYYSVLASGLALISVVWMSLWTLSLTLIVAAAAAHSISDVFGGSAEPKPWERNCDHAVYNHFHGRWEPARRIIRYDGAVEDLALATLLAVPVYVAASEPLQSIVVGLFGISVVYTLFRKPLGDFGARLGL